MKTASHKRAPASRVKDPSLFASIQSDLFQQVDEAPAVQKGSDLDINLELLGACNTAIREAKARGLSRERIVDRINELLPGLPRLITLRQLNAWTAASQAEFKPFPARFLPAFCAATECDLPLRVLAQTICRDLVDAREVAALQLGQTIAESARLARVRSALLKQTLGG